MNFLPRFARWLGVGFIGLLTSPALADPFSFAVVGDLPYGSSEKTLSDYRALIDEINRQDPALVIHVGDTKSGGTLCTDATLAERLDLLNAFEAPTLYTPGDNEWTDCHRLIAGGYDPVERLDHIRRTYFADPGQSLGQNRIAVAHQGDAGYPENSRVMIGDVMFITAHVVGSNNGFEAVRPQAAAEFAARDAANREWLKDSFWEAEDAKAVVVAIHGNMFEFDFAPYWDAEGFLRQSGFRLFANALIVEAGLFGKPILLVYGDSHKYRMTHPFPNKAPNIMALETFGDKLMHAVQVHVRPDSGYPFAVQPLLNPVRPLRRK